MANDKWSQVKEILDAAIMRKPEERAEFLDEACDGNPIVRREVESLLSSFDRAEGFLEAPAINFAGNHPTVTRKLFTEGQTVGHYEIVRLIGVGGMGEVYLAKDTKLDRKVAIKVLNKKYESHQENIRRFVQEAKAASALNHPNILTIHEIDEFDGAHYIVSEYVEGKVMRETLAAMPVGLSKVLDISIQVASALAAAHSARIIHRDIKPENIVIRSDGYVKVLDFGLAKLLPQQPSFVGLDDETNQQNQTAKGLILGTINYMSPEQAKGEQVDGRTDIFSLGVVIYEMVTARKPFGGDSATERLANLIHKDAPPLSLYASGVPDELGRIVSRMLAKDMDERYQTAEELVADLKGLRRRVASEDSIVDSAGPHAEKVTEVLHRTTGDIERRTRETERSLSGRRIFGVRFLPLAAALGVLLIAAAAFAIYWRQISTSPSQPQIKSLAVLPLRSIDSQEDVLGLGIADALIRKISQTGQLTVRPISAVRRYLTVDTDALTAAKELNADAVLEGSVQRSKDRLRVGVNLLRASDGASLWSENFDLGSGDVFAIQDAVAQQVATRLQLRLDPEQLARLGKRSTSNQIAYEYYTKGLNSLDQRGFGPKAKPQIDATIDLFKKAVETDPNYALARAQLAFSYIWKALFIVPDEQTALAELAREELSRADAIDPQLAETHIARSWFKFSAYEGWQTDAAAREVVIAQQLNPNVGHADLGGSYYHMGLDDLSEREYKRALEIDPTSEFVKSQLVLSYYYVAKWDDYIASLQKYLPEEAPDPYYLIAKGRIDEAAKLIESSAARDPQDAYLSANRAMLFAAKGEHAKAEEQNQIFIKSLDKRVPSYHHDVYAVATVYAMMGRTDEAMKWLRESATTGFSSYTTFERDRFLDRIRRLPEFVKFMAELKPQYEKYRSEFH